MEENVEAKDEKWVDELILGIGNKDNVALDDVRNTLIDYLKTNRQLLLNLGLDGFRQFITLVAQQKESEAFDLLVSKMEADDILDRFGMNIALLEKYNADRVAFYGSLVELVKSLAPIAFKVLLGLLV